MGNPVLEIHRDKIFRNAGIILGLCRENGIEPAAVIKGYNAIDEITDAIVDAGFGTLASSRLPHLQAARRRGYPVSTLMLRLPMLSEAESVIELCDASLNSELETMRRLDSEAARQKKRHGVILMRDLGDLREGIFDSESFIETACRVERDFHNLTLMGVGANLSCYGTVRPTHQNMSQLESDAAEIERAIGRRLEIVSGGGSSSLPLLLTNEMPRGINHLRIGGGIMMRSEIPGLMDGTLPELSDETLVFQAEIIEIGEKPTHPIGVLGVDCFGNTKTFEDRGVRRRALLAAGAFDIGSCDKLIPLDDDVKILGCSSDHMIIDIHDSRQNYRLGGRVPFRFLYQAMLYATASPLVEHALIR
jgi:predicted amino acid racemase